MRRGIQQRQQLAVDAIHRSGGGQPNLHRDQIHDTRLQSVPRYHKHVLINRNTHPSIVHFITHRKHLNYCPQ